MVVFNSWSLSGIIPLLFLKRPTKRTLLSRGSWLSVQFVPPSPSWWFHSWFLRPLEGIEIEIKSSIIITRGAINYYSWLEMEEVEGEIEEEVEGRLIDFE